MKSQNASEEEKLSRLMKKYQGLREAGWSHASAATATVSGSRAGTDVRREFLRRVEKEAA